MIAREIIHNDNIIIIIMYAATTCRYDIVLCTAIECVSRLRQSAAGRWGRALFVGSRFSRERPTAGGLGKRNTDDGESGGGGEREDQLWRADASNCE